MPVQERLSSDLAKLISGLCTVHVCVMATLFPLYLILAFYTPSVCVSFKGAPLPTLTAPYPACRGTVVLPSPRGSLHLHIDLLFFFSGFLNRIPSDPKSVRPCGPVRKQVSWYAWSRETMWRPPR